MQSSTKTNTSSSNHSAETEMPSAETPPSTLETERPVRRPTLEDHVLKFIERNNRGIWIGILALCAVTVLVTERG
jgi:hypothetical protein